MVATHGHCVDGFASAVVFSRLAATALPSLQRFDYRACAYGPGQQQPGTEMLTGDENAILDFRFYSHANLTWYFDHHRTAFVSEDDRRQYEKRVHSGRYHFDTSSPSCARLIARVARKSFGLDLEDLEPLVRFADHVDSAAFSSPTEALDRSTPLARLTAVVERHGDDTFLHTWVPRFLSEPLSQIAEHPDIWELFGQLRAEHDDYVQHVRDRAVLKDNVVYADLTDRIHEILGKFVTYLLFPDSTYSVVLGCIPGGTKIAVGHNPWSGKPRRHDIGELCRQLGGGGHPFVGGVAFRLDEVDTAREVATGIARRLEEP